MIPDPGCFCREWDHPSSSISADLFVQGAIRGLGVGLGSILASLGEPLAEVELAATRIEVPGTAGAVALFGATGWLVSDFCAV